ADVILALDADFLNCGPGHVRHLHEFARRRRIRHGSESHINRLYVVESMPSGTGAIADHRWPMRSVDVEMFARVLAGKLDPAPGRLGGPVNMALPAAWLEALAADLMRHRGRCLVIAGDRQPPIVHAVAHTINHNLGNIGKTVTYTALPTYKPPEG